MNEKEFIVIFNKKDWALLGARSRKEAERIGRKYAKKQKKDIEMLRAYNRKEAEMIANIFNAAEREFGLRLEDKKDAKIIGISR